MQHNEQAELAQESPDLPIDVVVCAINVQRRQLQRRLRAQQAAVLRAGRCKAGAQHSKAQPRPPVLIRRGSCRARTLLLQCTQNGGHGGTLQGKCADMSKAS